MIPFDVDAFPYFIIAFAIILILLVFAYTPALSKRTLYFCHNRGYSFWRSWRLYGIIWNCIYRHNKNMRAYIRSWIYDRY